MSFETETPNQGNLPLGETGQENPFPTQHSRTSSVQSSTTDYDPTADTKEESRFPEIIRRDMEFFMARLTRTTSKDSTGSG
jgi:hypothetical protein